MATGGPDLRKEDAIDLAVQVFQGDEGHWLALLGVQRAHAGHQPGQGDALAVPGGVQFARARGDDALQVAQAVLQRVLGQVDADQLLFPIEQLPALHLGHVLLRAQQVDGHLEAAAVAAEEGHLTGGGRGVGAAAVAEHTVERVQQLRPRAPLVEHAHLDHRLQGALADAPQIDPLGQVDGVAEGAVGLALVEEHLHRALAGVLDGRQPIADGGPALFFPPRRRAAAPPRPVVLDGKIELRLVDAGRGHVDAQPAGVGHVLGHLLGVGVVDGQQGGDVLHRVVGLQIGRLATDDGVVGGVGLVEAVAGEKLDVAPDGLAHFPREAALHGPGRELRLVLVHQVALLLGHRLADHVRLARLIAGQFGGDADDLLLIDKDAVGVLQDGLQFRRVIGGDVPAVKQQGVHAADVFGDVLHRPGAEEGDGGDDVVEALGLHVHHQLAHARAFHLEDALHVAAAEHLERLIHPLVVVRRRPDLADVVGNVVHRVAHAVALLDQLRRLAHDRQRAQAQEIDLQQADLLDDLHRPLADGADAAQAGLAAGRPVQGHILHQRLVGDDDAGGVAAGMAGHALQLLGRVHQLAHARVALVLLLQVGRVELVVVVENVDDLGRLAGDGRDEPGDGVHLRQGHVEGAADVADGRPRAQRPEGDDLGDLVLAVLLHGVLHHLVPAVVGVVEVDVGHRHAAGVEEALEDEAVGDGVDAGDAQRVGHHRPRAAAAHVPPDVRLPRELAQIPNDQEIGVEAHAVDDGDLVLQPRPHRRVTVGALRAIAPHQPLLAQFAQVARRVVAVRHGEDGQVVALAAQVEVAHLGDEQTVVQRAGDVAEEVSHLRPRLEVVALVAEAQPARLVDRRPGLDA